MKLSICIALLQALSAQGIRIIQSNDDGWAELYVRTLNDALIAAGHDVVLSAPADNKSGSGSTDEDPSPRDEACEYDSCAAGSGTTGFNATRPDLNWVNSYPVTSIKYGIDTFGPDLWDGAAPELAVTGPNVGGNLFLAVPFSGTVGAAVYAVKAGIPGLAFSGADDERFAWDTTPVPVQSTVYAELSTELTSQVIKSGTPYLPENVFLNVNFPSATGDCNDPAKFKWILSRINPGTFSSPDLDWCGSTDLPTESDVIGTDGCYASISIGDADDKTTVNDVSVQEAVRDKLQDILSCLP